MEFATTSLPGVLLLTPRVFEDKRGYFFESYRQSEFAQHGITQPFVQINRSRSVRGVLRGMHLQIRHPQGKLISVLRGEIFDVVVDVNPASSSYGKWFGGRISAENKKMLWVPPGMAHGFYVLSDDVEISYSCTDYYFPEFECCLRWDDKNVGIDWPLQRGEPPLVSEKDMQGVSLGDIALLLG